MPPNAASHPPLSGPSPEKAADHPGRTQAKPDESRGSQAKVDAPSARPGPATITLSDRKVDYTVKSSRTAKKLRIRVGLHGVQVVRPTTRPDEDITHFLHRNEDWILRALDRADALQPVIKAPNHSHPTILFRGEVTAVWLARSVSKRGQNKVTSENGQILITQPANSRTPPARSLENWLRKQARTAIQSHLQSVLLKVRRSHGKLYIMAQRTKWANCSALGNLSFNWRLIMAPDFVLRYLVTHEAVHLAIPDHSQRFWLTVQSLCPETERARQWLVAHAHRLHIPLPGTEPPGPPANPHAAPQGAASLAH